MLRQCENALNAPIQSIRSIQGGDINQAFLLQTQKGAFFLKYNAHLEASQLLETEVRGLQLLQQCPVIQLPEILHLHRGEDYAFLILSYIKSGQPTPKFWRNFGTSLAQMHQTTQSYFGLDHSNFIGSLPQSNQQHQKWVDFFIHQRLQPQLDLALAHQRIPQDIVGLFEQLYPKLKNICPDEPPALVHGDLWSGNFMVPEQGDVVLIDPSVAYAHREMDLAMSHLFGGFDSLFYQSYEENYPLEGNFSERLPIYQLYYLMAHVNLFGGSYLQAVQRILNRFI